MSYIDKINVENEEYQLVGSGEVLPVGTELDIDKEAEIPLGWEEIEYDTGWVNLTLASNVTVREPSSSEDYTPAIRRIGNVVSIRGEINITQLPLDASSEIFINIPSGFIPTLHNIKCFNKDIYSTLNNTSTIYYWKSNQYTTTISVSGMWVLDELTTKRIKKVSETQVPSIGEIYDDQERVVGTWFGKPLYQITKEFDNSGTGDKWFNPNLTNTDKLFIFSGYAKASSGRNFNLPFINSTNSSLYNIEIQDLNATGQLKIFIGSNWTGTSNPSKIYITFRYTKTTD